MVYYAFDLLHHNGFDTRPASLFDRKRALKSILSEAGATAPRILYSEHFKDGADLYARASAMNLEGIVSKRFDAPYRSSRGDHWIKVKCWKRERFAVVGFVPEGSDGILKLRLARREGGALVYVGRVGTGWDRETARAIRRALEPLARAASPLSTPLKKADTTWVEPKFDAEITYAEITDDGMVRHPSFKSSCRDLHPAGYAATTCWVSRGQGRTGQHQRRRGLPHPSPLAPWPASPRLCRPAPGGYQSPGDPVFTVIGADRGQNGQGRQLRRPTPWVNVFPQIIPSNRPLP